MTGTIISAALALCAGYCIYRYFTWRDKKWLRCAGYSALPLTFILSVKTGASVVLFGGEFRMFLVLGALTALSGGLLAAGRAGDSWRPVLVPALATACVTLAVMISLPGYRGLIIRSHATGECRKVVKDCSYAALKAMTAEQKAEAALKMAEAIPYAADYYARIGLIHNLSYVAEQAGPALPYLMPLIEKADNDTLDFILQLLSKMGPQAKAAAPALSARLAQANPADHAYQLEKVLETLNGASARLGPTAAAPGPDFRLVRTGPVAAPK